MECKRTEIAKKTSEKAIENEKIRKLSEIWELTRKRREKIRRREYRMDFMKGRRRTARHNRRFDRRVKKQEERIRKVVDYVARIHFNLFGKQNMENGPCVGGRSWIFRAFD